MVFDSKSTPSSGPVIPDAQDERNSRWLAAAPPQLNSAQLDLLETYSRIDREEIIPHILKIRDQAWEIQPYPCIGSFNFLRLTLHTKPSYARILRLLQSAQRPQLLDLGCCVGQDLRKLVRDGAPAESLWGVDLEPNFIELGYNLFRDRDTCRANLMAADFLNATDTQLEAVRGRMSVVHICQLLHLFDWDGQVQACERIVDLMTKEKGNLVVGQQIAAVEAGEMGFGSAGRMVWKHNVESFERLWAEVGRKTGSEWAVKAWFEEIVQNAYTAQVGGVVSVMILFEVERMG